MICVVPLRATVTVCGCRVRVTLYVIAPTVLVVPLFQTVTREGRTAVVVPLTHLEQDAVMVTSCVDTLMFPGTVMVLGPTVWVVPFWETVTVVASMVLVVPFWETVTVVAPMVLVISLPWKVTVDGPTVKTLTVPDAVTVVGAAVFSIVTVIGLMVMVVPLTHVEQDMVWFIQRVETLGLACIVTVVGLVMGRRTVETLASPLTVTVVGAAVTVVPLLQDGQDSVW